MIGCRWGAGAARRCHRIVERNRRPRCANQQVRITLGIHARLNKPSGSAGTLASNLQRLPGQPEPSLAISNAFRVSRKGSENPPTPSGRAGKAWRFFWGLPGEPERLGDFLGAFRESRKGLEIFLRPSEPAGKAWRILRGLPRRSRSVGECFEASGGALKPWSAPKSRFWRLRQSGWR
jgi:hypothetical protein